MNLGGEEHGALLSGEYEEQCSRPSIVNDVKNGAIRLGQLRLSSNVEVVVVVCTARG